MLALRREQAFHYKNGIRHRSRVMSQRSQPGVPQIFPHALEPTKLIGPNGSQPRPVEIAFAVLTGVSKAALIAARGLHVYPKRLIVSPRSFS